MASTIPNTLPPVPQRTPMLDKGGLISQPWVMWFNSLLTRVGGVSSDNLTQANSNISTLEGDVATINGEITTIDSTLVTQEGQITTLQGDVTTLQGLVEAAEAPNTAFMGPPTGAAAAPTWRAIAPADLPGLTIVINTAKLTTGGINGSMTFTNGLLTAQVQAT